MTEVFKEHMTIACNSWMDEISKNGVARIDITSAFERIFSHTINHICFGEDINDNKFVINYYNQNSDKSKWTEKEVSMREAMHNMTLQCI